MKVMKALNTTKSKCNPYSGKCPANTYTAEDGCPNVCPNAASYFRYKNGKRYGPMHAGQLCYTCTI